MSEITVPAQNSPDFLNSGIKQIIAILAILGLLALAIICFRWSYADVLVNQIDYHLSAADKAPEKRTAKDWRQADRYLQQIISTRTQHPQYIETAERFYQVLDTLETEAPALIEELGWRNNEQQALHYAREGLQLIPTWPYLWKQLVLSKVTLKQFDQELTAAIQKSVELGAWEKPVQYEIAVMGLANWDNLNTSSQNNILNTIENMLQIRPDRRYDTKLLLSHVNIAKACMLSASVTEGQFKNFKQHCDSIFKTK